MSQAFVAPEPAWKVICYAFGAGCVDSSCECINEVAGRPVAQWLHSAGFLNCHRKAGKFLIRAFAVFGEITVVCERCSAESGELEDNVRELFIQSVSQEHLLKPVFAALQLSSKQQWILERIG